MALAGRAGRQDVARPGVRTDLDGERVGPFGVTILAVGRPGGAWVQDNDIVEMDRFHGLPSETDHSTAKR